MKKGRNMGPTQFLDVKVFLNMTNGKSNTITVIHSSSRVRRIVNAHSVGHKKTPLLYIDTYVLDKTMS